MKRNTLSALLVAAALLAVPKPLLAALGWESIGPNGGDIFGIEASPADPDTLFALSFPAVFRSTDAAATWEPVHDSDMGRGFISLAFDPQDADHLFLATLHDGVWESSDQGDTWVNCSSGLPTHPDFEEFYYPITSLATTPDGRLFAGLGEMLGEMEGQPAPPAWIYRSDNGCNDWVPDGSGISLGAPQLTQNVAVRLSLDADAQLWAMVYGGGIYAYQAGSWVSGNGDLPADALQTTYLEHDPTDSSRRLVGTERNWIYETTDAGQTWNPLPLPGALRGLATLPLAYNVTVDPNNPELVYAFTLDATTSRETPLFTADPVEQPAGGGGYMSASGGDYWSRFPVNSPRLLMDAREIVTSDLPPFGEVTRSRIWYAASFGVSNLVKTVDGGGEFQVSNEGLTSELVNTVWLHPSPPPPYQQMLFEGSEASLGVRTDESPDWLFQKAAPNTIIYTWSYARDPLAADNIYYATGNPARSFTSARGIYRAGLDCFGEGCELGEQILGDTGVWRVITTPAQPATVYAATQEQGILVSYDQGSQWAAFNDGLTLPASVTDIALDANGDPLLAAKRTDNGNITADPPQTWVPYFDEPGAVYRFESGQWQSSPDITVAVYDLEPHPTQPQTFFAATAEGIYETIDGGQSWQVILPSALTLAVLVDPLNPSYMYAATRDALLRSTDGGVQWHDLSDGLWQKFVLSLALEESTGTLYAGTKGGSIFELVPDPSPLPQISVDPTGLAFDITPVGFSQDVTVTVINAGEADLTITDVVSGDPTFTVVDLGLPVTLTPRGEADLTVRFSPQSVGVAAGLLTIHSNDPLSPAFDYPVSGDGRAAIPPAPDAKLDGSDGPVTIPKLATANATGDLIAGDYLGQSADFWVRQTRADGTVLWLVAGSGWVTSATPLRFRTAPIADLNGYLAANVAGVSTGTNEIYFGIDDNADGVFDGTWSDTATFTVQPAPPALLPWPVTLDFGQTAVGLTAQMTFALVNSGEQDLIVNAIDTGSPEFALLAPPAFPLTVARGSPVLLKVEFSPQSVGTIASTLTIHSDDPLSPAFDYPVSGEGIAATPPSPNIQVNGSDGPLVIPQGQSAGVTISLDPGSYGGENADWWILRFVYNAGTESFDPAPLGVFSSPLYPLSPRQIFDTSTLAPGLYVFTYMVDLIPNGQFDAEQLYSDRAVVQIQ